MPERIQLPAALQALTVDERNFVRAYYETGGDWTEAAKRARFHPDDGRRLMANPAILKALEYERRNPSVATASAAWVKNRLLMVATADPRELTEHWRVPCRHCWGQMHFYQWRDAMEYESAKRARELELESLVKGVRRQLGRDAQIDVDELYEGLDDRFGIKDTGGYGYTINRDPMRGPAYIEFVERNARESGRPIAIVKPNADADCPRCDGHGVSHAIFHDTRRLSPGAALLYQGVKLTKDGLEFKQRDPRDAEDALSKVLGLYAGIKPLETLDPTKMTRENLIAAIGGYAELYGPDDGDEDVPFLSPAPVDGPGR